MGDVFTQSIDTNGFKSLVRELSDMSGTPIQTVILEETGKVLEHCVRGTPERSRERVTRSVEFRNRNLWEGQQWPANLRGDPIISITKSQVAWFIEEPKTDDVRSSKMARGRKVGAKTFHIMNDLFRWSDERWGRYQYALGYLQAHQTSLEKVLQAVGLMKHSWFQIAEQLGIDIKVPARIRNARPSNGQIYLDGQARKFTSPEGFYVEIENSNPILVARLQGAEILSRAVQARIAHFQINMEKGVFEDLKRRARLYPGVFVT